MTDLELLHSQFAYGDWANDRLVAAAEPLSAEQLDQRFDIGMGSLRRTIMHVLVGEEVWLARWRGETQKMWGGENEPLPPAGMTPRFEAMRAARAAFFGTLRAGDLDREQVYRDSKGSQFRAALRDMLIQGFVHSTHHRAQAVNILRRLGQPAPELDFMMHARRPA